MDLIQNLDQQSNLVFIKKSR